MLAGYITFEELKLITGYNEQFLQKLISKGLPLHEVDLEYDATIRPQNTYTYKKMLFNIQEVEDWLRVHVF